MHQMLKYRMGFRTKLSLLVVLLLPLLLKLGFWQMSRYHEKLEIEQALAERQSMPPIQLSEVSRYADPLFLPVNVSGHFIVDRYFFLDNQIWQGQAGYSLIMPFVTDAGEWLLVNRGWLPAKSRDSFPEISTPSENVELSGQLYRLFGTPFTLGEDNWSEDWPKRIQAINFTKMSEALGQPLPLFTLVLNGQVSNQAAGSVLQVVPLEMKTTSQKHLGYAVQWFLMALVLLGLYLWQMKIHHPTQSRQTGSETKTEVR